MSAILFALLTASLYYLGSRAMLTRALWSRYPAWFAGFADCAACTGFWYGVLVAATVGYWNRLTYLGLDLQSPVNWFVVGIASIAATPLAAGAMQRGLDALGVAVPEEPAEPDPEWQRIV